MSLDTAHPRIGPFAPGPFPYSHNPSSTNAIWVDRTYWVAAVGDRALDLTRTEFDLLAFFLDHPYVVFDRRALLRQVWRDDVTRESRKIDVHVARVRRKLGPDASRQIETIRSVGYRYRPTASHGASEVPA